MSDEELLRRYRSGETMASIAGSSDRAGRNRAERFRRRLRDLGEPSRKSAISAEVTEAARDYERGMTIAAIASARGIVESTLYKRLIRSGVPMRGREVASEELRARAVEMRAAGVAVPAIAKSVGRCQATVYIWLADAAGRPQMSALPDARRRRTAMAKRRRKERAIEMYGAGATMRAIAAEVGAAVATVAGWIRKHRGEQDLRAEANRVHAGRNPSRGGEIKLRPQPHHDPRPFHPPTTPVGKLVEERIARIDREECRWRVSDFGGMKLPALLG